MKSFSRLPLLIPLLSLLMISASAGATGLRDELNQHATSSVHVLTREVHVFHYAPRTNVIGAASGPIGPYDVRARNYLHYLKELFWDANRGGGGVVGSGLYVALDPVYSFSYGGGGTNWVLLQTVMPARTRFLDLMAYRSFEPALQKEVTGAGCSASNLNGLFSSDTVPACRALRDQLVRDLDIMAIRYPFGASSFPGVCVDSQRPQAAFVIFDDRALALNRLVAMTAELPAGPGAPESNDPQLENRLLIQSLFVAAGTSAGQLPWPALQDRTPRTDVRQWARQTLLSCGKFAEDAI